MGKAKTFIGLGIALVAVVGLIAAAGWAFYGAQAEIAFQTSRELRDGAYLDLETTPRRGVVSWEEIGYDELPAAARDKLPQEG